MAIERSIAAQAPLGIEPSAVPKTSLNNTRSIRPRLDGLTSLRFLAACDVILFHLKVQGILTGGPWWYQNFAGIGYIRV